MDRSVHKPIPLPAGLFAALVPVRETSPIPLAYADATRAMGKKRLAEFVAGRRAAHRALRRAGGPACVLARKADGAPHWPEGWTGSITHDRHRALAVVSRAGVRIGVDLEDLTRLDRADAAKHLCLNAEEGALFDSPRAVLCAFSAKEAVFKAMADASKDRFWLPAITLSWSGPDTLGWRIAGIGAQGTVKLCVTPRHVVSLCVAKDFAPGLDGPLDARCTCAVAGASS